MIYFLQIFYKSNIIMSPQTMSILELKTHYETLFTELSAGESAEKFIQFLRQVVQGLSYGLTVDLTLLEKDLTDPVIAEIRHFGALESLRRVLLPIAEGANYKATLHPDWSLLAGRIEIQRLKLQVPETFSEMLNLDKTVWRSDSDNDYYDFANSHAEQLEGMIVPERDYDLYFFGVRTLEKSYLMRLMNGGQQLLETPQRMYLRIAAFLWMPNLEMIKKYYDLMSLGMFTHASPTMFNSGIAKGSLASCFLLSMQDDLEKIFKCLGQCAMISKSAGGIGLDISNIRHSSVGHMGQSSGIVPMLKVYDAGMRYVDQCFDPDTIVYTKAGPKRIADIGAGEKLVTISGGFGTVAKPMHYTWSSEKQMYKLYLNNYPRAMVVAGVHPMLSLKNREHPALTMKLLENGAIYPEYLPVEQLDNSYLVALPIPTFEKDLPLDIDDCYLYGLLLNNGAFIGDNSYELSVLKASKQDFVVKSYLENRKIEYSEKNVNVLETKYSWQGGAMFPFSHKMFRVVDSHHPAIHPSILHLPKPKIQAIVDAFKESQRDRPGTIMTLYNSVFEGLRYLLLRLAVPFTVSMKFGNYSINLVENEDAFYCWHGFLFTRIAKLEKTEYNKSTIVELEMVDQSEEGANYLTVCGIAHNGGRRKGSATIFLQPWHIDFPDFIEMKRQHGKEERRARDLFYAVWNCDIFMTRVRDDKPWTMFCPKFAPKLKDTYGEEFDKWYLHYEEELMKRPNRENFCRQTSARTLWNSLLTTQIEAGMPFITNKDTANYTSNQKNLGLIRSSNLCVEIVEVTDENTISSCNLASISLDEYVTTDANGAPQYDHQKLGEVVRLIVRGLNRVIDRTYYPLQEHDDGGKITGNGPIKSTNFKYRPLGLGVQGLADAFLKMGLAWSDATARALNREIFATIYYNAIAESVELAKVDGVYQGFYGSPASQGLLKPDLIAEERARKKLYVQGITSSHPEFATKLAELRTKFLAEALSSRYDWQSLRDNVRVNGIRNSLLIALMPTASSAQIRYKNESFEPFTTNMYVRSVLSGNHLIVNRYMVKELTELGLWNKSISNFIIKNEGSIAKLPVELVPEEKRAQLMRLKEKCATAFELSQKLLVDMAIDRAYYVCQSQSLNIHSKEPSFKQLTSLHFYAWENGLTTGMYYLRTAPSTEAIQFTVEGEIDVKKSAVCSDDICIACTA